MRRSLTGAAILAAILALLWFIGGSRGPRPGGRASPPPVVLSEGGTALDDRGPRARDEVAVFLTRESQQALAAARVLETAGIPFTVTSDTETALQRRIVFVPCDDRPLRLDAAARDRLRVFVAGGGTLILQTPVDLLQGLTGLTAEEPSRTRKRVAFRTMADDGFRYLDEPEEREILLVSPKAGEGPWTHGLKSRRGVAEAVAVFPETRQAAVLRRRIGSGRVYTLGLDLRDAVLRPQTVRYAGGRQGPADAFEPGADVWPLVFRAWYEKTFPFWVRLRAFPGEGKSLLVPTHCIGWGGALDAARAFSVIERQRGVRATYFVQTAYRPSPLPVPEWDARMRKLLEQLVADGHELAAHTVSHGPDLARLPFGTGKETAARYRPSLGPEGLTHDGTLLGEIRVPKVLIEEAVPGVRVIGSRSAFRSLPDSLDSALSMAGMAYDSSLGARDVLGYSPFHLLHKRAMEGESAVVELPMGVEDENAPEAPLDPEAVLRLLRKTAANESPLVWLVHPTASAARRAALARVLDGLPPGTAVLTAGELAEFWKARAKTRFSFEKTEADRATLSVWAPAGRHWLSFEVSEPVRSCEPSGDARVRCVGRLVVLEESFGGRTDIRLGLR